MCVCSGYVLVTPDYSRIFRFEDLGPASLKILNEKRIMKVFEGEKKDFVNSICDCGDVELAEEIASRFCLTEGLLIKTFVEVI